MDALEFPERRGGGRLSSGSVGGAEDFTSDNADFRVRTSPHSTFRNVPARPRKIGLVETLLVQGRVAQAISERMATLLAGVEPAPEQALSTEGLYRRWAPFVWRLVMAMGGRSADAPDLMQEVFIVAHRRLGELRDPTRVRAWLYGICIRCVANYRRRAHRKNEVLCAVLPEVGGVADATSARLDLLRALDSLDDDRRAVFVLYEIEELSMPEIAEALGCPVTTAYCRLYSARKVVRALCSGDAPHSTNGKTHAR